MSSRMFKYHTLTNAPKVLPKRVRLFLGSVTQSAIGRMYLNDPSKDTFEATLTPTLRSNASNAQFSPDGKFFVVTSMNAPYAVLFRRDDDGNYVEVADSGLNPTNVASVVKGKSICFSTDGSILTFSGNGSRLYFFRRRADGSTYDFVSKVASSSDFSALSPDGQYAAIAAGGDQLYMYKRNGDVFSYLNFYDLNLSSGSIQHVVWGKDGKYLFVCTSNESRILAIVSFFNEVMTQVSSATGPGYPESIAVSPDGQHIAITGTNYQSSFLQMYKWEPTIPRLTTITMTGRPAEASYGAAFSPDGVYFAYGHRTLNNSSLKVWRRIGDAYILLNTGIPAFPENSGCRPVFSPIV